MSSVKVVVAISPELIPVAVARHPAQAIPLQGSWFGSAGDYLGMDVSVSIHKVADFIKAT